MWIQSSLVKRLISIILIFVISYIIGKERSHCGKAVGFRSVALVMLGAFAFTITSTTDSIVYDYHVIAQIVSGISFIGIGLIWKGKDSIYNLTTAICMWTSASIGILLGLNKFIDAVLIAACIWLILISKKFER